MSPFNAFQFIQGLETLPLRMREHCRTRQRSHSISSAIPRWRASSTRACTRRPSSAGAPRPTSGRFRWARRLRAQAGPRSRRALHRCAQALLSRGQHRRCPLAGHPSGQHHALAASPADQLASGVTPGYVRLSVGIEHIDDIMPISTRPWRRRRQPVAEAASLVNSPRAGSDAGGVESVRCPATSHALMTKVNIAQLLRVIVCAWGHRALRRRRQGSGPSPTARRAEAFD